MSLLLPGIANGSSVGAVYQPAFEKQDIPQKLSTRPAWNNRQVFRKCGLNCNYEKANEVIILDSVYEYEKFKNLSARYEAARSLASEGDEADRVAQQGMRELLQQELNGFCHGNARKNGGEHPFTCFERYRKYVYFSLNKKGSSVKENSEMVARLKGQKGTRYFQTDEGQGKKNQYPILPTLDELRHQYVTEVETLDQIVSQDFIRWAETERVKPQEKDFAQYDPVFREKNVPTSGKLYVKKRDCQGPDCFDQKKFQTVEKLYSERYRPMTEEAFPAEASLEEGVTRPREFQVGKLSEEAYLTARQAMLKAVQKKVNGEGAEIEADTVEDSRRDVASVQEEVFEPQENIYFDPSMEYLEKQQEKVLEEIEGVKAEKAK